MPLVNLHLPTGDAALPDDVRAFLAEAGRRIERFQANSRCHGFVPSDFVRSYAALRTVAAANLAPGQRFCEWGSGFGVVADLAAMLDFDACGIEIDGDLVLAARQLAADFDLPVEFVHDSFIPRGGESFADTAGGEFAWLTPDGGGAYDELGLDPDDFDLIFAYPWPDEEDVIDRLFDRYAADGALLLTFHGSDDIRLQRKTNRKLRGRARAGRR